MSAYKAALLNAYRHVAQLPDYLNEAYLCRRAHPSMALQGSMTLFLDWESYLLVNNPAVEWATSTSPSTFRTTLTSTFTGPDGRGVSVKFEYETYVCDEAVGEFARRRNVELIARRCEEAYEVADLLELQLVRRAVERLAERRWRYHP